MNKLVCILFALTFLTTNIHIVNAGDDDWRRFGEAAAIYLGVRALTGWDPIKPIIEYPRNHRHRQSVSYGDPNISLIQSEPCNKISAYPCEQELDARHAGVARADPVREEVGPSGGGIGETSLDDAPRDVIGVQHGGG